MRSKSHRPNAGREDRRILLFVAAVFIVVVLLLVPTFRRAFFQIHKPHEDPVDFFPPEVPGRH